MGKRILNKCLYFGFDPGQTGGGVGWICGESYGFFPIGRRSPADLASMTRGLVQTIRPKRIATTVEQVGGRPGEDVRIVFGFGRSFGRLEQLAECLAWLEIPIDTAIVSPQAWQTPFGLFGGWDGNKARKKEAHKHLAANVFPDVAMTDAGADALLIAAFGASCFQGCALRDVLPWFEFSP